MIGMKSLAIIGLTTAIGGVVGASQILCPDGSCAITGSWFGGAFMGGFIGLALAGGTMVSPSLPEDAGTSPGPDAEPPTDEQARD